MDTVETHELTTSLEKAEIVDATFGWTHEIANTGNGAIMLRANEVFDWLGRTPLHVR